MSEHHRIDILSNLVKIATSQMKERKKQKYESLLKGAKQSGTLMGTVKGFLSHGAKEAEQLFNEDDDGDNEVDIPSDDDDDDHDSSHGSEEIPEAGQQVQQLAIQEEDDEELKSEQEQDPDRIKIHE
ncbi:nucleolin-like [Pocillopora damicornis]|uniref:nucleolin-like n=1 Tax=Pocillopora damicornis TaxID=46731 RepID=UPI000F558F69|nr:nucleolin-like [Pocillopora damicornis]